MKTKKYVIALAIFGGMLFLAQAATQYSQDEQQTAKVRRDQVKVPTHG